MEKEFLCNPENTKITHSSQCMYPKNKFYNNVIYAVYINGNIVPIGSNARFCRVKPLYNIGAISKQLASSGLLLFNAARVCDLVETIILRPTQQARRKEQDRARGKAVFTMRQQPNIDVSTNKLHPWSVIR